MSTTHRRYGRKKPYTEIGVRRLPCFRCGKPAQFQWSICADGNLYRPVCARCDVGLNWVVLVWADDPDVEAKLLAYERKVRDC